MTNKVELTVGETVILEQELQAMLSEESISFGVKYDIIKILEKIEVITKRFSKSRYDIIKKYGTKLEGEDSYTLEGSKQYDKGIEELNEVSSKIEVVESSLKLADFKDIKTKVVFRYIYKLLAVR